MRAMGNLGSSQMWSTAIMFLTVKVTRGGVCVCVLSGKGEQEMKMHGYYQLKCLVL